MAIALEGTPVITPHGAAATSAVLDLASGAQVGELAIVQFYSIEGNDEFNATGWTIVEATTGGSLGDTGFALREVTEDNKDDTTMTLNVNSGSSAIKGIASRWSGVDISTLISSSNSELGNVGSSLSSFSIASGLITVASDSAILMNITCEAARNVSSADADLDLVANSGASGNTLHSYVDIAAGGTGNPQYDFTMSDSRNYDYFLLELPASGVSTPTPAISAINTSTLVNGRTAVNLTGTDFGTATGVVTISSENSLSGSVTTAITPSGWADTSASFTASRGAIQLLTDAFMFVTSDAGETNTDGATVSFTPIVTIEDSFQDISATAQANLTNLSVLVWHDVPTDAPDQVLSGQTLDANGTASWEISLGSLSVSDPVWVMVASSDGAAVMTAYKASPSYD